MTREELLKVAKPILLNTDMVRAILDRRKTVTRRIIKPQPKMILCYAFAGFGCGKWMYPDKSAYKYWGDEYKRTSELTSEDEKRMWIPPYHTDDILYVRETYKRNMDGYSGIDFGGYIYKADCKRNFKDNYNPWKPSIHMPKEAARIFLKVTDVRVERLQDITDEQAEKEGCNDYTSTALGFCYLWDSTIKKSDIDRYGWDANPWVWVIEFERIVPDV